MGTWGDLPDAGDSRRHAGDGQRELHADARAVLAAWVAPDETQESLRRTFLALLDAEPDCMFRQCEPDHLTGSALIVRHCQNKGSDEVLLVHHSKAGKWLQTGGHCEPTDATLAESALREAREESGISGLTVDPVPLLLSRHHVPFCGSPPAGGHHLDVQFLVRAPVNGTVKTGADEDEARWFPLDGQTILGAPPACGGEPTDQAVRELIAAAMKRLREIP